MLKKILLVVLLCWSGALMAAPAGDLQAAARTGDLEQVKKLVEGGADVNVRDKEGATPLLWSLAMSKREVATYLIAHGADVKASAGGVTPLHIAAALGMQDIAELLIAKGADVNAREDAGRTPLFGASVKGQKDMIELLVAKGADVNARSKDGKTALHVAASPEIVALLVAKGADANIKDNDGFTASDRQLRNKLSKVISATDPVRVALAMYYQENGKFPAAANAWEELGFENVKPTSNLPREVSAMSVAANSGEITVTLANIGPGIDGTRIKMIPVVGTAMDWKYSCTSSSAPLRAYFTC